MNPKLDLFDAVKARIEAEVPEIKTFRLYNNQFAKEGVEKAMLMPALMVEFIEVPYTAKSESMQEADLSLNFHLAFASLKTEDRYIFELAQKVNHALQGFLVVGVCTPFNRKRERQDSDHDGLIVWQMEYTTLLADNSAHRRTRLTLVEDEITVEIEKDPAAPRLAQSITIIP